MHRRGDGSLGPPHALRDVDRKINEEETGACQEPRQAESKKFVEAGRGHESRQADQNPAGQLTMGPAVGRRRQESDAEGEQTG